MISVIAWIIAGAAWLVILLAPVALVALAVVPRCRRWWLRPLLRRVTGRQPERIRASVFLMERRMEAQDAQVRALARLAAAERGDPAMASPPDALHLPDCSRTLAPYVEEYIRNSRLFGG